MTIEEKIWTTLKNYNFTDYAVAGIMGNLFAESALKSNNLEDTKNRTYGMSDEVYTSSVDNGTYPFTKFVNDGAGYGLAQWTSADRKKNLYYSCKGQGVSISDINCQLALLYKEVIDYGLFNKLNNANNIQDASTIFLTQFERPADQSIYVQNYRANLGQNYYNKLKDTKIGGNNTMKYNSSNPPLKCIMTNSTCFQQTRKMSVKGVLWHSTGANNPNLKRYVQPSENDANYQKLIQLLGRNTANNDWNHISVQAGLNAWIGKLADGTITTVQTMPWDYRPWGCGSGPSGSCNDGWVQFEICEDGLTDKRYFDEVYKEACEFTAYICNLYQLNPKGTTTLNGKNVPVILCHQDSYRLGLGSNHSDVLHWFNNFGKTMDNVRNDVAKIMNNGSINPSPSPSTNSDILIYTRLLKRGRRGDDVKALQNALIKLGYSVGSYGADGDFGQATETAVIQFQKDNHLDDDGEAGINTISKINELLKSNTNIKPKVSELYRVRKAWDNTDSQIGAFAKLENAKKVCDSAGPGYYVFNNNKQIVYAYANGPIPKQENTPITPATKYTGVKIGSSSKDEYGQYRGGQAGDQTGKEVYINDWYSYNWTNVLRANDPAIAEKIAVACEQGCNNDHIGYDQWTRNTLLTEAKKVNYDLSKITTPCNCDCSSFVSVCCVCAGLSENIFFADGNGRVTSNIVSACLATGKFSNLTNSKYLNQKNYLKRGDILLNSSAHVVIVLSNESNAK